MFLYSYNVTCNRIFNKFCVYLFVLQLFTAPIIELGKVATAIKGGDMGARVKIGSVLLRDEIDDLRRLFNSMAEEIATNHAELERKVCFVADLSSCYVCSDYCFW